MLKKTGNERFNHTEIRIEHFHSCDQQPCRFLGTNVSPRKELIPKRIGLVNVLQHHYDVKIALQVYSTNGTEVSKKIALILLLHKFHNLSDLKMPCTALCALTGMQVKKMSKLK